MKEGKALPAQVKRQKSGDITLLIAEIVESLRIASEPRREVAKYLGSIDEAKLDNPAERAKVWRRMYAHLSEPIRTTFSLRKEPGQNSEKIAARFDYWKQDGTRYYFHGRRHLTLRERKEAEAKIAQRIPLLSEEERRQFDVPTVDEREQS
jgi:hypothetical protein